MKEESSSDESYYSVDSGYESSSESELEKNKIKIFEQKVYNFFQKEKDKSKVIGALRDENINLIENLIKSNLDFNFKFDSSYDNHDFSLAYAVRKNNKKIVELLISSKVDLNLKDRFGNTALKIAVDESRQDIVQLLIDAKADLNIKNNLQYTVLFTCIEKIFYGLSSKEKSIKLEDRNIFQMLIKAGADITCKNKEKLNALGFAQKLYDELKQDISENSWDYGLVLCADLLESGSNIVNILQKEQDKFDAFKKELFKTIEFADFEKLKKLAKFKSFGVYDDNGNNPLHFALIKRNLEIFKYILAIRPSLITENNNNGLNPLQVNPGIIKALLE